jgi:hypothetical protein
MRIFSSKSAAVIPLFARLLRGFRLGPQMGLMPVLLQLLFGFPPPPLNGSQVLRRLRMGRIPGLGCVLAVVGGGVFVVHMGIVPLHGRQVKSLKLGCVCSSQMKLSAYERR